ncbi:MULTISPECIES: aspartate aminotransferase family protein [unclassified Gordonia (in: high G+C Gram-positive bacteria)]
MGFSNIMDSNIFDGTGVVDPMAAALVAGRQQMLGPAYRLFYDRPVHLVRGRGSHLFDAEGNRYLDAYNNVACVGHAHPYVTERVAAQLGELNTHTRYLHEGLVDYSARLLATLPVDQIMYACTGSEANDLALRVADTFTGNRGVIVTEDAYHGNSAAVSMISPSLGSGVGLGDHVRTVPAPTTTPDASDVFAANVRAAIADLRESGYGISCLIVDTLFSSDGIFVDPGILGAAVRAVHDAGGVFIADEVQPGFGRTGDGMWGFARSSVVPDIVTLGKPMGNGYPVAAMAAARAVLEPFATTVPYFNTFAGSPAAMAAAGAVLDVIEDEDLIAHAKATGERLHRMIDEIGARHDAVAQVRGRGLYIGVELRTDGVADRALAKRVTNELRERRVLISVCGRDGNVLKIRPPMVFSASDADWFGTELDAALSAAAPDGS